MLQASQAQRHWKKNHPSSPTCPLHSVMLFGVDRVRLQKTARHAARPGQTGRAFFVGAGARPPTPARAMNFARRDNSQAAALRRGVSGRPQRDPGGQARRLYCAFGEGPWLSPVEESGGRRRGRQGPGQARGAHPGLRRPGGDRARQGRLRRSAAAAVLGPRRGGAARFQRTDRGRGGLGLRGLRDSHRRRRRHPQGQAALQADRAQCARQAPGAVRQRPPVGARPRAGPECRGRNRQRRQRRGGCGG